MELLYEILFEIYLELMMMIVPEEKTSSKLFRVLVILVAIVSMLGILALFIWGWILLFERHNFWGILPFSLAIILSLAQIVLGFVLSEKKK